jgi:hypothetical protein
LAVQRILDAMTSADVAQWFAPPTEQAERCMDLAGSRYATGNAETNSAILNTLSWAVYGGGAPISGQRIVATAETARTELNAATFVVQTGRGPTALEWRRIGNETPPRVTAGDTGDWARGAAAALAWLLGDTAVPPIG